MMVVVRQRRQRRGGTIGYIRRPPLCRNFSFDILKCFSPIRMEIWMAKSPALGEKMNTEERRKRDEKETYMFSKDIIIGIFDFMKVIFIQLSNETRKI